MLNGRARDGWVRGVLAAAAAVFCFFAVVLLASDQPRLALIMAVLLLVPYALYLAVVRPMQFPYGLYVLLVPFDNLLLTGKAGTLTKLLGIVAGFFILTWIAKKRPPLTLRSPSVVVLTALLAWMFASTYWSLDEHMALAIMPTYAGLFVLYFAIVFAPITAREFRPLLGCAVAGGLAAAAYGAHAFYQNPPTNDPNAMRLVVQTASSSIDPNHFANSLLLPAAILMMWALRTPRISAKIAGLAGMALFTVAIISSASRQGLIGLGLIVAYFIARSRYRLQLIVATGVLAALATSVKTILWMRFADALASGGSGRTGIWAVATEAAKHRILQGYGIGNFIPAYNVFYLGVPESYRYPYGYDSPAHSIVFHYVVELGIVGFLLIVWFFLAEFRSMRAVDPKNDFYDYRIALEASMIALAFVSTTIDLFTYKYAWLIFAMVALLRTAATGASTQRRDARDQIRHNARTIGAIPNAGLPAFAHGAALAGRHRRDAAKGSG